MNITFKGLTDKQHVFTNGIVTRVSEENVKAVYPAYFTRNGKDIFVQVYAAKSAFALRVIKELEAYFREPLEPTFKTYVYGISSGGAPIDNGQIHRKLGPLQLQTIL